jgi:hypothetical protein
MTVRGRNVTSHCGPFSGEPGCAGNWNGYGGWRGKHQPHEHNGHNIARTVFVECVASLYGVDDEDEMVCDKASYLGLHRACCTSVNVQQNGLGMWYSGLHPFSVPYFEPRLSSQIPHICPSLTQSFVDVVRNKWLGFTNLG